jgi:hypothetical protein
MSRQEFLPKKQAIFLYLKWNCTSEVLRISACEWVRGIVPVKDLALLLVNVLFFNSEYGILAIE